MSDIPEPGKDGLRIYGNSVFRKKEDTSRCIVGIIRGFMSDGYHQCGRKRGHGRDGLFCKQHAKKYERRAR